MAPPKAARTISQQAFDEVVMENIDDLGMDPSEALADAVETLTLQGVDLSGIVLCVPGATTVKDNPVIECLDRLKQLDSDWEGRDCEEVEGLFDKLSELCCVEGNAVIASRNRGVELACSICSKMRVDCGRGVVSSLKALALFIHDLQSTDAFHKSCGEALVMDILKNGSHDINILNSSFSIVAAAATGNEVVKDSFMELKIDELIVQVMREQSKGSIQSLYDSIRVLVTADDNRVVASQVYGYARRFAKLGIAGVLVESLQGGLSSPSLVSASITLKAIAVNDEICRSIAENGGIDAVLRCIDDSGLQRNRTVARACCSLLSKLAGSDANKNEIVDKGGMDGLIKLSARFSDEPSVLQEVMSIICALSLRSPNNAARAIEAGAGDIVIQAMQKFPAAQQMQRNSCLMIRNLVVRNPENRTLLLNIGIEKFVRKAKENHESCKDAASAALRDLGLNDYNL
ncbi:uncharacterized protein LOC131155801 isoform X2 [Malania oleifera]|nr:uncharacterized protein LOC131155801 isoform X2 [Malania oleifera]